VKSENDIIENGIISFESVVGDEFIDEDMCRVEGGGDTDAKQENSTDDKTSRNLKYSYAPKCLVLLSRVHDFRILKVICFSQALFNVSLCLLLVQYLDV